MLSVFVNAIFVIIGSFLGLVCKKIIRKDICDSVLKALGITVMVIGIVGAAEYMLPISEDKSLPSGGSLLIIIAIAVGTLIGEFINIDKGLNILGDKIEKKINRGNISEGFVNATLIFCVGSMAIVGSFDAAMGNPNTIYIKTVLDCVTSIVLASTLGFGVALSSLSILIYQGALTICFYFIGNKFPPDLLNLFNCVGYVMIATIGINFVIKDKVKVANMLPALIITILIYFALMLF